MGIAGDHSPEPLYRLRLQRWAGWRAPERRHTVLTFSKIADFYAHSSADVQRLMENNALVIIDFDRAIELGYVQLTERIAALVKEEYGE